MEIEIRLDETCREPRLILVTGKMTEELDALVRQLSGASPKVLAGFRDGSAAILEPSEVLRVYAAGGKVYAAAPQGEFLLRQRLYELEQRLSGDGFVRISNSELVNLRRVRGFGLDRAGTIRVTMADGSVTYVSRRYVSKIKEILGI